MQITDIYDAFELVKASELKKWEQLKLAIVEADTHWHKLQRTKALIYFLIAEELEWELTGDCEIVGPFITEHYEETLVESVQNIIHTVYDNPNNDWIVLDIINKTCNIVAEELLKIVEDKGISCD